MLTILSPAKSLTFSSEPLTEGVTRPEFQEDAQSLVGILRNCSASDLRRLMTISEDLAQLNVARFKAFGTSESLDSQRPAALVFSGDTYQGLEAAEFSKDDFDYAQAHLRILSGLYGVLRPLDLIEPYRLEMGTRLKTEIGATLYEYWGDRVARALEANDAGSVILNCASQEYFKVAERHLQVPVITPQFKEERDGQLKMISFFAKRARGALARFVVANRIDDPKDIQNFDIYGYRFDAALSAEHAPVFTRMAA